MMEVILNNKKIKYEDGVLYCFMDFKTNPHWREIKGTQDKDGYLIFGLCYNRKRKNYKYHRVVYKLYNPEWDLDDGSKENEIDHINGDRINNNINNLRRVNHKVNSQNRHNAKGYYKSRNKFQSQIVIDGKKIILGRWNTEEEAHKDYLEAVIKYKDNINAVDIEEV